LYIRSPHAGEGRCSGSTKAQERPQLGVTHLHALLPLGY
jgi:hypothetical protein